MHARLMPTFTDPCDEGWRADECADERGEEGLCVWVERCPVCLGALERFHAPISNEMHRTRHTLSDTLLGIHSAHLPASDEKKGHGTW